MAYPQKSFKFQRLFGMNRMQEKASVELSLNSLACEEGVLSLFSKIRSHTLDSVFWGHQCSLLSVLFDNCCHCHISQPVTHLVKVSRNALERHSGPGNLSLGRSGCKIIRFHRQNVCSWAHQVSTLRYSNPTANNSFEIHIFTIINSHC